MCGTLGGLSSRARAASAQRRKCKFDRHAGVLPLDGTRISRMCKAVVCIGPEFRVSATFFLWFFVDFTVIFYSRPSQIELSAMKQNARAVVGEVAKATCIGLDELDGTVESLSAGVADSVTAVVEQSLLVTTKHLDDFLDRW